MSKSKNYFTLDAKNRVIMHGFEKLEHLIKCRSSSSGLLFCATATTELPHYWQCFKREDETLTGCALTNEGVADYLQSFNAFNCNFLEIKGDYYQQRDQRILELT